jgi:hypothetical protein
MATVVLEGDKVLVSELSTLPAKLQKRLLRTTLKKALKPTLSMARAAAPFYAGAAKSGTLAGLLRGCIQLRVKTKKNKVLSWVGLGMANYSGLGFYGWFQEFGWLAGGKNPRFRGKGAAQKRAAYSSLATASGARSQVPAKKFLRNAYDATESQVLQTLDDELGGLVEAHP